MEPRRLQLPSCSSPPSSPDSPPVSVAHLCSTVAGVSSVAPVSSVTDSPTVLYFYASSFKVAVKHSRQDRLLPPSRTLFHRRRRHLCSTGQRYSLGSALLCSILYF
ncbi:uncharacterized protein LOC130973818 isoform X2 [Arachis stenosperma]|uniref:uncharacterized protein LOC130973818 isoform X2 n=1 Tax=Arachis stenosperma TaxID=217475 RepID=UPI0025ABD2B3|nr:uncharacterized protein LOC130973818 isoform X2 [Arachis stenosperma]XP_057754749.1 uncharacterized protein LOC130973818 isoform X2 [Arachis stenosperma]XP_057754821.1 uncharacterized protein LOC130973818 isoform X2 [Arachis stenosperma]